MKTEPLFLHVNLSSASSSSGVGYPMTKCSSFFFIYCCLRLL